jgi:hypothetical protein
MDAIPAIIVFTDMLLPIAKVRSFETHDGLHQILCSRSWLPL